MTNGNKLYYKTCREQAGFTQEQAVKLLGIAETATLSRYENGHAPVSQDLVADMVKVYRCPSLAWWHVRHTNPDLAQFLMEAPPPITDGDMMLNLELADDDITEVRAMLKKILRDGRVTSGEVEDVKLSANALRSIASQFMVAAGYLDEREVDG